MIDSHHYKKHILKGKATPIIKVKIWNGQNTRCWRGCGTKRVMAHCWWECKMETCLPPWKSLANSYKTTPTLPTQSCKYILWYLPKGVENLSAHKSCTQMDILASFRIVKTWRQPRCPSVGEKKERSASSDVIDQGSESFLRSSLMLSGSLKLHFRRVNFILMTVTIGNTN